MKSKLFKSLLLVVAAIALVVTTVFATMAFMTDSAKVTNTFTVGNITLDIRESNVDANGQKIAGDRTSTGNKYRLIPGKTYDKDPFVTVSQNSDPCYLFVEVKNGIAAIETTEKDKTIHEQIIANGWAVLKKDGNTVTKNGNTIYYRPNIVDSTAAAVNYEVFGTFKTKSDVEIDANAYTSSETNTDPDVVVTAYAIQSTGFTDANGAWDSLLAELNN